jgi:hypothetical protein
MILAQDRKISAFYEALCAPFPHCLNRSAGERGAGFPSVTLAAVLFRAAGVARVLAAQKNPSPPT